MKQLRKNLGVKQPFEDHKWSITQWMQQMPCIAASSGIFLAFFSDSEKDSMILCTTKWWKIISLHKDITAEKDPWQMTLSHLCSKINTLTLKSQKNHETPSNIFEHRHQWTKITAKIRKAAKASCQRTEVWKVMSWSINHNTGLDVKFLPSMSDNAVSQFDFKSLRSFSRF